MHSEAKAFIERTAEHFGIPDHPYELDAVDLGGRETNGHARDVFGPKVVWTVVDMVDGPGVDVVADAATWGDQNYDIVLCAEVFEHTPRWPLIIANAYRLVDKSGVFIATAAGPRRAVHGVNHDDPDQPGWYMNIEPMWLDMTLRSAGFKKICVEENKESHDVYAWATK